MKLILITRDVELTQTARGAFVRPDEVLAVFDDWRSALEASEGAHMIFVDLIATLSEPHKIAGYERFAEAKMTHEHAKGVPLVLIAPPPDYELDFLTAWPDFVLAQIKRPVAERTFKTAATWA